MNKTLQVIKNKINKMDWILTGTVLKSYRPCGKKNCQCTNDKTKWHGPYYYWTWKENAKTITKTLSKNQAQFVRGAFKNQKIINDLLKKWREFSKDAVCKQN